MRVVKTPSPRSLLVLDGDPSDLELALEALEPRVHSFTAMATDAGGLERLQEGLHAACLLVHRSGEASRVPEVAHAAGASVPVLVLTSASLEGEPGRALRQTLLAAGAADVVSREGLEAGTLGRALRWALELGRAWQAVSARDRLLRAVLDATPDAMVFADDERRYVDVNASALRLIGVTREEFLRRKVGHFGHPLDGRPVERIWEQLLHEGHLCGQWDVLLPDGQRRVLEFRATARILPNRHLLLLRDVTDERRVEEMKQRLGVIVSSADDAILVKDLEGRIQEWSPGAEHIYGWRAQEVVGRSASLLVPPERAEEWAWMLTELRQGRQVRHLESVRVRKDGRRIDVVLTASALRDADGRVTGASSITRDVTETRQLRTRIAISDRMASVGTLAAGVAHEINNPLAALLANLHVAKEEVAEAAAALDARPRFDEALAALHDAAEAGERVRQIVTDIKLFSRPDEVRREPVDPQRVLESTLRMVWNEARHRARLVKDYRATSFVSGNESRLGQVFLNLIVNAVHAIPEGRAGEHQLRISTRDEGGRVVVEISDTGMGIAEDRLQRIFEPFYTTKPVGQGTGLGLSICHGIVTSLGGDITVRSRVGQGTTFQVSLPAIPATASEQGEEQAPPASARRARVLVIDDEQGVLQAVTRVLGRDHELSTRADAGAARRQLGGGEHFDLILCDLMMPQLDGVAFYAALGELAPALQSRVVFLTGGAFTPRAQSFLAQVRNPRIDKPFDPDALRAFVQQWIA